MGTRPHAFHLQSTTSHFYLLPFAFRFLIFICASAAHRYNLRFQPSAFRFPPTAHCAPPETHSPHTERPAECWSGRPRGSPSRGAARSLLARRGVRPLRVPRDYAAAIGRSNPPGTNPRTTHAHFHRDRKFRMDSARRAPRAAVPALPRPSAPDIRRGLAAGRRPRDKAGPPSPPRAARSHSASVGRR